MTKYVNIIFQEKNMDKYVCYSETFEWNKDDNIHKSEALNR